MAIRYARTDALGLVVAPPDLDCIGLECSTALNLGRCFVDEHHLYFSREKFTKTKLASEFRDHPFNKIKLPRCAHDRYHKQVSRVEPPNVDVMAAFLEEAEILKQLGVVTKSVLNTEKVLYSDDIKDVAHVACSEGGPKAFAEFIESGREEQLLLLHKATQLEVVPQRIILASNVVGARAIWGSQAA